MKKEDLRIVFMGTPEFAVPSLRQIIELGYNVVGVITAPDRQSGRGKKVNASAIKKFALDKGLNLLQPANLKNEDFLIQLAELKADLQVVIAFRMLPEQVWAMPPLGTFNLHASLLPQYRGAAPINHAIMNGEKSTGLTTFFLDALIDTGKIIKQQKIQIKKDENAGSLHNRMMLAGADLIVKTIELICIGKVKVIKQSKLLSIGEVIYPAPKIFKADCKIDWEQSIDRIYNFVRGLSPYPAAFTNFISPTGEELLVKIFEVSVENAEHEFESPRLIIDKKKKIKVAIFGGFINILELQLAGKKRLSTDEFLKGTVLNSEWKVR